MAWRLANSLVVLRNQINSAYPNRSKVSDGTIGDSAHASSASDHNPNVNGVVCAMDITHSPQTGFDAHALADHLRVNRHPNLRYLVSNSRIAGSWTNWNWQSYSGSNPHDKHIHVSVGEPNAPDGQSRSNYDNETNWSIGDNTMTIGSGNNWYNRLNQLHQQLLGRPLGRDVFNAFVGKDTLTFIETVSDHPETIAREKLESTWESFYKTWANRGELTTKAELVAANQRLIEAEKKIIAAEEELAKEKAKPPVEIIKEVEKPLSLNKALTFIIDYIKQIFKKG